MSERELLRLAAKAYLAALRWDVSKHAVLDDNGIPLEWDPLASDGEALRLAADTCLRIDFNYHTGSGKQKGIGVWPPGDNSPYPPFWTMYGKRPDRDVRYTIVRAAAHVGKDAP